MELRSTGPDGPADSPCASTSVGSDCVICSKGPEGLDIKVLQVIEGLAYHHADKRVMIRLLFVVHNEHGVPASFRITHRGNVSACLSRLCFDSRDPQVYTLLQLYAARLWRDTGGANTAHFRCRVNCLSVDREPRLVCLDGPGDVLAGVSANVSLAREKVEDSVPVSYSTFLIPQVAPGRTDVFVVDVALHGETYDRLVGSGQSFSVDSYTRLVRDIVSTDLPGASPAERGWFLREIAPAEMQIAPLAYDIVIFQELGTPVEVTSESICIVPVQPDEQTLASKVLWFFGNPVDEFFLRLRYVSPDAPPKARDELFVVACGP